MGAKEKPSLKDFGEELPSGGVRCRKYGLNGFDLEYCYNNFVFLDLKPVLVLMNDGNFHGYDRVIDKKGTLAEVDVPKLYGEGKHDQIIQYVRIEANKVTNCYHKLKKKMPELKNLF